MTPPAASCKAKLTRYTSQMATIRCDRRALLAGTAACLAVLAAGAPAGCGHRPDLKVTIARRTEKLVYPGGTQSASATDAATQVLLVFKVTGITKKEFDGIPRDKVRVESGTFSQKAQLLGHSDADGGSVSLFAPVPRSALAFTLHLGDRPPLAFEAEPGILPELQPRR